MFFRLFIITGKTKQRQVALIIVCSQTNHGDRVTGADIEKALPPIVFVRSRGVIEILHS